MTEEKKQTKAVCKKCGAEYATAGQLKRVAEKLGSSPEYLNYCPACKRARLAEHMAKASDES
ncbi:MAG: hypothetical protein ABIH04_11125 [Planctomycetota bacterium]